MNTGNTENIRTRFAPSPTGFLHVGGARTALFNWIYARRHGGKFLLRVEDTDPVRSTPENTRKIFDDLKWLGINWDEEVIYQSARSDIYRQYANLLLETDKAYRCFCTAETLAEKRHLAEQNKLPYLYDKTCRRLTPEVVDQNLRENKPFTLRLKVPAGETTWRDLIRENIRVANREIDDFIILRSDGTPVYQLAVVVDDHFMEITHIIRGDDHISNTPKQILLYNAFGWDIPLFGHIPLILGADKKRLSKRHGATSVGEFRERGYLADALKNYLVLLGWSPGDDREIMSMDEIIKRFSLENIQKKSAIFDEAKLQWFNALYIRNLLDQTIFEYVTKELISRKILTESEAVSRENYIREVIRLLKPRARLMTDFIDWGIYFYEDPKSFDNKGVQKYLKNSDIWNYLVEFTKSLQSLDDFTEESIETLLRNYAEEEGISAAKIIHPVRLAISGRTATPGLFEIMVILGKESVLRRLSSFVERRQKIIQTAHSDSGPGSPE